MLHNCNKSNLFHFHSQLATLRSAISVASLANLQNLAGFQSSLANTPLNLTMSSTQHQNSSQQQQTTMPQLILASGQLVQGIQGAQLLIPTSQGIKFSNQVAK